MSDIKESFINKYRTLREEKESMAARYIKKASVDWASREHDYGKRRGENPDWDFVTTRKENKKRFNREIGIERAVNRLTRKNK